MSPIALRILVAAIAAAALAGCATPAPSTAQSAPDDREFRTGSRIPVRDGSGPSTASSTSDKQAIDDMMRRRSVTTSSPNN